MTGKRERYTLGESLGTEYLSDGGYYGDISGAEHEGSVLGDYETEEGSYGDISGEELKGSSLLGYGVALVSSGEISGGNRDESI